MKESKSLFQSRISYNRWLLFALKAFSAGGFFFPIWYMYEQQYLTLQQIALLEGCLVGIQLLLEIPTGAIADLFGVKLSVVLGYLTQAAALVFFAFARSFPAFLMYAFVMALGESLRSGAEDALEYDSLKAIGKEDEFPKYKSWYSLTFQLSLAAAFIVGGMIGKTNMTVTIWMTMISLLLAGIVSMLLLDPLERLEAPNFKRYFNQFSMGWKELTHSVYSKHITTFYVGVGIISWTTNISLMNIYLTQLGFSADELGWVAGILRVINIVLIMKLLKPLMKPHLTTPIYIFFMMLFLIGYIPAFFLTKWYAVALVGMIMISTTARWIVLGSYLNRGISSKNRATALSTASMMISVGHMAIMVGPALLMQDIGGAKTLVSLLGIIGAVLSLVLLSRRPSESAAYAN